jgi:hypothetical protein
VESYDLLAALHQHGVTVLHAVKEPRRSLTVDEFLVFLEGNRGEADAARACLEALAGVEQVAFACHSRAILHVYARP